MPLNKSVGYGAAQIVTGLRNQGKTFVVVGTAGESYEDVLDLWTPDNDGVARNFTTVTLALAQTVAGRGDVIILANDYTTALTATNILDAETNGVTIIPSSKTTSSGVYFAERATNTLPQSDPSDGSAIFTVTGKIKLLSIQGVVTTQIATTATDARLVAVSTVGTAAQADLCTSGDIIAASVGAVLTVGSVLSSFGMGAARTTPTWARTPLQIHNDATYLYQITPIVVQAGTINLTTGASSTGSIKWRVEYEPMEPGARCFAAALL